MRRTRCPQCKGKLEPGQRIHPDCIQAYADAQAAKSERKQAKAAKLQARAEREGIRARKEAIKTIPDLKREAQVAVNRYVRARDAFMGCVSCDKPADWGGQWHASHFRSVGAADQLRFNLWNIHKACSVCNNWLSGNISEYAPRLRRKIGGEKVDYLLENNEIRKYNRDYLLRLKKVFSRKARRQEYRNETRNWSGVR